MPPKETEHTYFDLCYADPNGTEPDDAEQTASALDDDCDVCRIDYDLIERNLKREAGSSDS